MPLTFLDELSSHQPKNYALSADVSNTYLTKSKTARQMQNQNHRAQAAICNLKY